MVKHTQAILWQQPTNCLIVFDHFMGLTLERLNQFHANVPFYIPLKHQKTLNTSDFLMFSVVAKKEHGHGICQGKSQLTIACPKSQMKALDFNVLNVVLFLFEVNNGDNRPTSIDSVLVFLLLSTQLSVEILEKGVKHVQS